MKKKKSSKAAMEDIEFALTSDIASGPPPGDGEGDDLDAPAPEPEPAAPEAEPSLDAVDAPLGSVPVYNPTATPFSLQHDGDFYPVRAGGISYAPRPCVDRACGPDNTGGPLHRLGVRRLYAVETDGERFEATAKKNGKTVREYLEMRNTGIVYLADEAARSAGAVVVDGVSAE